MGTTLGTTDWLRVLREVPAPRDQLVCFPPGGGTASSYRDLSSRFDAAVAVLAVQYPGRQDRIGESPIRDLEALAEHIATELLRQGEVDRLTLFGHSFGATVAFETARRLERAGQEIAALFVSGRPAPAFRETGRLHLGSDEGLIAELERLAADPAPIRVLRTEPALAELVLPAVRGDYQAVETYVYHPGPLLTCPVTAMVSTGDPTTTHEQADRWREVTTGAFDTARFPGGHFYLDENVGAVADFVAARLRRSQT